MLRFREFFIIPFPSGDVVPSMTVFNFGFIEATDCKIVTFSKDWRDSCIIQHIYIYINVVIWSHIWLRLDVNFPSFDSEDWGTYRIGASLHEWSNNAISPRRTVVLFHEFRSLAEKGVCTAHTINHESMMNRSQWNQQRAGSTLWTPKPWPRRFLAHNQHPWKKLCRVPRERRRLITGLNWPRKCCSK